MTTVSKAARAAAVASVALVLAACGAPSGNPTDRAFAAEMVPHHRSAVDMAELARTRARTPFVRRLAADVERSQGAEIRELRSRDRALAEAGVARGDLGMGADAMGMRGMDLAALARSRDFDRDFLRMMIPHHQGAVRMARTQLERGEDPALLELSRRIVRTQEREIRAMRAALGG